MRCCGRRHCSCFPSTASRGIPWASACVVAVRYTRFSFFIFLVPTTFSAKKNRWRFRRYAVLPHPTNFNSHGTRTKILYKNGKTGNNDIFPAALLIYRMPHLSLFFLSAFSSPTSSNRWQSHTRTRCIILHLVVGWQRLQTRRVDRRQSNRHWVHTLVRNIDLMARGVILITI